MKDHNNGRNEFTPDKDNENTRNEQGDLLDKMVNDNQPTKQIATVPEPAKEGKTVRVSPFINIRSYIAKNLPTLVRNEIRQELELNERPVNEQKLNSEFINFAAGNKGTLKDWQTFLNSDHVPTYNPLKQYFENNPVKGEGYIKKLTDTLIIDPQGLPVELVK